MAVSLCKPPDTVSFSSGNAARNWQEFVEQLHWFLAGTESNDKADSVKIGIMLTHAGKEAREIYKTLPWESAGDNMKFDKVLKAFKDYCQPRKNILYERYKLWSLKQEDGESVDTYLTRLKLQVDHCEYDKEGWPDAVKTETVRDKFVFGLRDDSLKERLLQESSISLNKLVALAQRTESSRQQIKEMKEGSSEKFVDAVIREVSCGQCGRMHKPRECPAYGQRCSICHKYNHFARVCRSRNQPGITTKPQPATTQKKRIHTVADDNEVTEPEAMLSMDALQVHGMSESTWLSTVDVHKSKVTFKLDTGAEASVLLLQVYKWLKKQTTNINERTSTKLSAYGGSTIIPVGTCVLHCTGKTNDCELTFFIVSKAVQPILGLRDCISLGLIQRIHTIQISDMSKSMIKVEFADVFKGLGNLGTYHITLKDNAIPVIHSARRIPHSLLDRLKQCLETNLQCGVLKRVDEPTDWVNSLVIVEKKNGTLRLCLDPRDLNKAVKREHYKIPTAQEISSRLAGKKIFSTLDLKDGYWQVELDDESSLLCTFNTPFGRYRFTRMPFGLSSASEVFQKKNELAFQGIEGVHIMADDIIIAASTIEEHDGILHNVLDRARERNVKFNLDKLQLRVNTVKYLGTIISEEGIKPDPDKVIAISNMPIPTDKPAVRRLLGMVNFLANHIPNMSTITAPLRDLVKEDTHFQWGPEHNTAVEKLKAVLSDAPVLQYFDARVRSVIQADASQHGLGACLMQKGRPVAYASRSLSAAECNYAQIEKELLAIVFACNKFHHYVYGFPTDVQSDHKPLEQITTKPLCHVSPRLQRMLLKLQRYNITIKYTRGKDMHVADALSRAHLDTVEDCDSEEMDLAVHTISVNLPISESRRAEFISATETDQSLQQVKKLTIEGWPNNINNVPGPAQAFWKVRDELHVVDGLILAGERLVIPVAMKRVALQAIHEGHMGIEKCKQRGRSCMYWPSMSSDIETLVKECEICNKFATPNRKEPMIPHQIPSRPWEKVGVDYFTLYNQDYLLVVDYFSKYPEVIQVSSKTSAATIKAMKATFARHGIPNIVVADNMPFNSVEFRQFSKQWHFTINTSSPNYPQSNGLVERNVQTVKRLFRKAIEGNTSTELALLELRNTPITGMELSPAQLLMSRRLRSVLPMTQSLLTPTVSKDATKQLTNRQNRQVHYYNRGTHQLMPLSEGDTVQYKCGSVWKPAVIVSKHPTAPRSYLIKNSYHHILRRNRRHLKQTKESPPCDYAVYPDSDDDGTLNASLPMNSNDNPYSNRSSDSYNGQRVSRFGRPIRAPTRYIESAST